MTVQAASSHGKHGAWWLMGLLAGGLLLAAYSFAADTAHAQTVANNKIIFDNQAGQNAVAKLVGPTTLVAKLRNGQKRSVYVAKGEYYLLVRYGNSLKEFTYTKSDPFVVTEPENQHSILTITLHRVVPGNFHAHPVSGEEFDKIRLHEERSKP